MQHPLPKITLWLVLGLASSAWAQTPSETSSETKKCNIANTSYEDCASKDRVIEKVFTRDGKDLYSELSDEAGKIIMTRLPSGVGRLTTCYQHEGKTRCEWVELSLATSITKAKKYAVYTSDEALVKGTGATAADVAALSIDWSHSQVVVWAGKAPKSSKFVVVRSGALFDEGAKTNAGKLIVPFSESCGHGGIPNSEVTPAPAVNVVVAVVPSYLSVTGVSAPFQKFGASTKCNIPSAPPGR